MSVVIFTNLLVFLESNFYSAICASLTFPAFICIYFSGVKKVPGNGNAADAEEKSDGYGELLRPVLQWCIDRLLSTLMASLPPDSIQPVTLLVENTMRLFHHFYQFSEISDKYEKRESSWDELSVKRIFLFACTWTFGVCSPTARSYFSLWYRDVLESVQATMSSEVKPPDGTDGTRTSVDAELGPPIPYDYYLVREHEDEVYLQWVPWSSDKHFIPAVLDIVPHGLNCNYVMDSVLVPTRISQALACIQEFLINFDAHICVVGESSTGKSSLLRYLASQDIHKHRWMCFMRDGPSKASIQNIFRSRSQSVTILLETSARLDGSVFIDDLCLQEPMTLGNFGSTCMEYTRYVWERSHLFDSTNKRWVDIGNKFGMSSCRLPQIEALRRFIIRRFLVCSDTDMTSILSTRLCHLCPSIREALATDLAYVSVKLVEQLNTKLLDIDLSARLSVIRPVSETVAHWLDAVAFLVTKRSSVAAVDALSSWLTVINMYVPEHISGANFITSSIDDIMATSLFKFAGFQEVMLTARKKTSTIFSPKKKVFDLITISEEINRLQAEAENDFFFGFMSHERVASHFSVRHAGYDMAQGTDWKSPSFWADVQKLGITCCFPNAHYTVLLGGTVTVLSDMLACAS